MKVSNLTAPDTWKVHLNSLLLVLILVGYQWVALLASPWINIYTSRVVTVPFRAVCLAVATTVLCLNIKKCASWSPWVRVLFLFWLFYGIRIGMDVYIWGGGLDSAYDKTVVIYYLFIITPVAVAISLVYNKIDYNHVIKILLSGSVCILLFILYYGDVSILSADTTERIGGGAALNPISFGMFSAELFFMGLWVVFTDRFTVTWRIVGLVSAILGMYFALLSGSRGPVIAIIMVSVFWLVSASRYPGIGIMIITFIVMLLYLTRDFLVNMIVAYFPVLGARWYSMLQGDTSGREYLYLEAWNVFLENPLIGKSYSLPSYGQNSHNAFLDVLIGMGMFGGILYIGLMGRFVFVSYTQLAGRFRASWLVLFACVEFVLSMTSVPLYTSPIFVSLLALLLSFPSHSKAWVPRT